MLQKIVFILFLVSLYLSAEDRPKIIHIIVALCDNESQGIVPVPKKIGNGDNPNTNLYWGCAGGVKAEFCSSKNWDLISISKVDTQIVIERAVFKHKSADIILIADAYRGKYIWRSLYDFIYALSGNPIENEKIKFPEDDLLISAGSKSSLLIFLGHNGLMDFQFTEHPKLEENQSKDCIVLCCKSRTYFSSLIEMYKSRPVLLTEQLMYPGAMVLEAAIEGWIKGEDSEQIRDRAADAYAKNQKISFKSAKSIFSKL